MSFQATVINVMIASPSDVSEVRQAVRNILYEWNTVHADERKQVLLPVGWETHSAPDMGGTPQSIINKQVLADCDLLVGLFWTRIGTATAEYASGAVEEIERHAAAGKPAMVYFSEAPIPQEVVSSKQYKQLQKFKDSCKNKALYSGFNEVADFKDKFRNQLKIIINQHFKLNIQTVNNTDEVGELLSADEYKILEAAKSSSSGVIRRVNIDGGDYIMVDKENFIKNRTPKEIAYWYNTIEVLIGKKYIRALDNKGEAFTITNQGFEALERK